MKIKVLAKLVSEANNKDHWSQKKRRSDVVKFKTKIALLEANAWMVQLPCEVTLTRIAPRNLDDDNLRTAFKNARDTCAAILTGDLRPGRADNDSRITWHYAQRKGLPKEYAFEMDIISI